MAIYMNGLLIFSLNEQEHELLLDKQRFVKTQNRSFLLNQLASGGFMCQQRGEVKMDAIRGLQPLFYIRKRVQKLLGLALYCLNFTSGFPSIAPLWRNKKCINNTWCSFELLVC